MASLTPVPETELRARWLMAAVIALVPFALLALHLCFTADDAYISFRYARHLVEGQGLCFNPGENPPVEGFSNLLWVLWLAPMRALGWGLERAANASSIACGAVLVMLVARWCVVRIGLALHLAALAALSVACSPSIAVWSTSGLETMPFALALFGIFAALATEAERPRTGWAMFATGCAVLLRADGAAWAGLVLALSAFETRGEARRALALCGATLLLITLALVLWRWSYFGEFLPNTARIKAGPSAVRVERGARYVATYLLAVPSVLLCTIAACFCARGRTVQSALTMLAACLGYAILVGGDFMPMGRFLVPAIPFVALLCALAMSSLSHGRALALGSGSALLSLLACLDVSFVPASWREALHFRWNEAHARSEVEQWSAMRERALQWKTLGRALAQHTHAGESIVLGNIGAIGYESELVILDVFGLVDRDVATAATEHAQASPGHDRGVGPEFFFARKPTYLGATIAPRTAPAALPLPESWTKLPGLPPLELVRIALDESAGFPRDSELRLVRLRWPE